MPYMQVSAFFYVFNMFRAIFLFASIVGSPIKLCRGLFLLQNVIKILPPSAWPAPVIPEQVELFALG